MSKQPVVTFRVDKETYALLEKVALAGNQSVGAYARERVLEALDGITQESFNLETVLEELKLVKSQTSKGVELLARLICREHPDAVSDMEETIAQWVKREVPR